MAIEEGDFDEQRMLCEAVFRPFYVEDGKVARVELGLPLDLIASGAGGSGPAVRVSLGAVYAHPMDKPLRRPS